MNDRVQHILEEARALPYKEKRELWEALFNEFQPSLAPCEAPGEMAGQVMGYWYPDVKGIPETKPSWDPTGAILPRLDGTDAPELLALDLVLIEGGWYPLSEAGKYSYSHSLALIDGEKQYFVTVRPWAGSVFEVEWGPSLDPAALGGLYGEEAAARARKDKAILQLKLRRIQK